MLKIIVFGGLYWGTPVLELNMLRIFFIGGVLLRGAGRTLKNLGA